MSHKIGDLPGYGVKDWLKLKKDLGITHHDPCPHPRHGEGPEICPLCKFDDVKSLVTGMRQEDLDAALKEASK